MDKAQLAEMLAELDPAELRVLKYEMHGGHTCSASSTLYNCCGEQRCEACHIPHLKEKHDTPALHAYEKFVNKWQLTWQGYVPPKQNKVTKKSAPRSVRPAPKVVHTTNSIVDAVNDDNIEALLELLAKKLGK